MKLRDSFCLETIHSRLSDYWLICFLWSTASLLLHDFWHFGTDRPVSALLPFLVAELRL